MRGNCKTDSTTDNRLFQFFPKESQDFVDLQLKFLFFNGQFQGYDPGGKERKRINSLPLKFPLRNNAFFFSIGQVLLRINQ